MICGFEFEDGDICMQEYDHEYDGVPHLRYGEGAAYWLQRRKEDNETKN